MSRRSSCTAILKAQCIVRYEEWCSRVLEIIGDRKISSVCQLHELATLAPHGFVHGSAPIFYWSERPVDEKFSQIDASSVAHGFGQSRQDMLESPILAPPLEPAVADLVRRVPMSGPRGPDRIKPAQIQVSGVTYASHN